MPGPLYCIVILQLIFFHADYRCTSWSQTPVCRSSFFFLCSMFFVFRSSFSVPRSSLLILATPNGFPLDRPRNKLVSSTELISKRKLATVRSLKADFSNASPSSERMTKGKRSKRQLLNSEGLTLESSAFKLFTVSNCNLRYQLI